MTQIKKLTARHDLKTNKQAAKRIAKKAIKKLPKAFGLKPQDVNQLLEKLQAGYRSMDLPPEILELLQDSVLKPGLSSIDYLHSYLKMKGPGLKTVPEVIEINNAITKSSAPSVTTETTSPHPGSPKSVSMDDMVKAFAAAFQKYGNNNSRNNGQRKDQSNKRSNPERSNRSGNWKEGGQQDGSKNRKEQKPVKVAKMDGMNGHHANRVDMFAWNGQWKPVNGCLDSGATMTVGSFDKHAGLCLSTERLRKPRTVQLPNETQVPITHYGKIRLRVDHTNGKSNYLEDTRIALVGEKNWPLLLVGHDILTKHKATPEQVLFSMAVERQD